MYICLERSYIEFNKADFLLSGFWIAALSFHWRRISISGEAKCRFRFGNLTNSISKICLIAELHTRMISWFVVSDCLILSAVILNRTEWIFGDYDIHHLQDLIFLYIIQGNTNSLSLILFHWNRTTVKEGGDEMDFNQQHGSGQECLPSYSKMSHVG